MPQASFCALMPWSLSVQDLKGLGYEKGKPVGLVGVTELSDAQKKQLKEQQEVTWGAGLGKHKAVLGPEHLPAPLTTRSHRCSRCTT